jgi:hypothetical protein
MKVIDIQPYLKARQLAKIEKEMANLYVLSESGVASKMKMCFRRWLEITRA